MKGEGAGSAGPSTRKSHVGGIRFGAFPVQSGSMSRERFLCGQSPIIS